MREKCSRKNWGIINRPPWDLLYALGLFILAVLLAFLLEPATPPFAGFELDGLIGRGLSPFAPTPSTSALTPSAPLTLSPTSMPSLTPTPSSTPSLSPEDEVWVVIVVDDLGYSLSEAREVILSSQALTLAVLPSLAYSLDISREAAEHGKEILLHLPMESHRGNHWLGPGAVMTAMNEEEVHQQIQADLYDVPGAIGVNNHMGTKATCSQETMSFVIRFLKERGMFFLDSKVTVESVAEQIGNELGVQVLENNIFLDNEKHPEAVHERLEELKQIARRKGYAIGIAHVQCPALAAMIEEAAKNWQAEGVKIVPISRLLSISD